MNLLRASFRPEEVTLDQVPCAGGGGGLILDSVCPAYRDCSRPDLKRATTAPWVERK